MKTLSLARPLIMLVVGLPGSGKSFFARQFAETFSVACVRADVIRHELFGDPQFTSDENEIVGRIVDYMTSELTKTGRSFMVDGSCNTRAARLQVEQLAKTAGYDTLVIWVQTDPAAAKARALRRSAKKADDAYNVSLSATQFELLAQRFAPPTKEKYVVISGMHAYSTQARTVLKRIAAPHAAATEQAENQKVRQVATLTRPQTTPSRSKRNVVIR